MSGTQDWDAKVQVKRLLPKISSLSAEFAPVVRREITKADISDELLTEYYIFMAKIVETYGEAYFPIFERLHNEIEKRNRQRTLLDTALKVASGSCDGTKF